MRLDIVAITGADRPRKEPLAWLAALRVADIDRLNLAMADYFDGRSANWARPWLILSTEAWLRARSQATPTTDRRA